MPLDAPLGQPQDFSNLDALRRRAGLTPAYQKLNPQPIMVPMSPAEIVTLTAVLDNLATAQQIGSKARMEALFSLYSVGP